MKFNFLKLKKKGLPSLKSLKPQIFDIDLFWFVSLGLFLIIVFITSLVGFKLFYSLYTKSYKDTRSTESFKNIINVDKLNGAIEKRNNFINQEISIPKDPSI